MSSAATLLIASGSALLLVSGIGLFRLPDALARQHAATKSCTLALLLILAGTALEGGHAGWWIRSGVIVLFLVWTLPVSAHMLARAAARHAYRPEQLAAAADPERELKQDRAGGKGGAR